MSISIVAGLIGAILAILWGADQSKIDVIDGLFYTFFLFGGLGLITYFALKLFSKNGDSNPKDFSSYQFNYEEEYPSLNILEKQTNSTTQISNQYSDDDFSFHVNCIRDIATEFNDIGISFFGCYGLLTNQENLSVLIDKVLDSTPPKHYGSNEEWKKAVEKNSYNIFFRCASKAIDHEDPKDFDFETILLIFPGIQMETTSNYVTRLQNAIKISLDKLQS